MISISLEPGHPCAIELMDNGCVVLGPAYDRGKIAKFLADRAPLPFVLQKGQLKSVEVDTYGVVHFHSGDFARNSEVRALLEEFAALKVEGAKVPGRTIQ